MIVLIKTYISCTIFKFWYNLMSYSSLLNPIFQEFLSLKFLLLQYAFQSKIPLSRMFSLKFGKMSLFHQHHFLPSQCVNCGEKKNTGYLCAETKL